MKEDIQNASQPHIDSHDAYQSLLHNEMIEAFFDSTASGMFVSNFDTEELLFANQTAQSFFACDLNENIDKKCWSFISSTGEGRCPFNARSVLLDENGNPLGKYIWEVFNPNHNTWLKCVSRAIKWSDGRLVHMVTFTNITETKTIQDQLENFAFYDQHLHLHNRFKLEEDMCKTLLKPSLVICDLLSLQEINEAYGRDIGDMLLVSVRDWLLSLNVPDSCLYRIGGNELALSVSYSSPYDLRELAQKIHKRFDEDPWVFEAIKDRPYIFCNASVIVIHGEYIHYNESFLNLIDRTVKTAKNSGKVTIYNTKMDNDYKRRLQLELSLKRCVRENMDGFDVYYQPIADPATGTWCGLEALCRWNSPELGPVSPLTFIPEAERLELIESIGLWALETAIQKCKKWGLDRHKKFILDVNLSALQFLDEMLAPKIIRVLYNYDYPGEKLSIEITESTRFTFTDQSLKTIELLRENNVLVALDDFGTGYSSFNSLKSLPIDILKIERVFITDIENDDYQRYLFHIMAELAHTVDMKLIVEGVEKKEQMNILLENGADLLQGYLFSRPLPPDQLENNLNRFYDIDESFRIFRNRKIDMKKLLYSDNKFSVTPKLYNTLNRCIRILDSHVSVDEAINSILNISGFYFDVGRTYIFLRDTDNYFIKTYEWRAEGIDSQVDPMARVPINNSLIHALETEGIISSTDISTLPQEYNELKEIGTKSIILLPLNDRGRLCGFLGFDDCHFFRDWYTEEIVTLSNIRTILAKLVKERGLFDAGDVTDTIQQ